MENNSDQIPLIVDLDKSLVKTDTLFELGLIYGLTYGPLKFLRLLFLCLIVDRPEIKRLLSEVLDPDYLFPINQHVLRYILSEKSKGRDLYLVSGADQKVVDIVSSQLGIFVMGKGSQHNENLIGEAKRLFLVEKFPSGFEYLADDFVDVAVWKSAAQISVVDAGKNLIRRLKSVFGSDVRINYIGLRAPLSSRLAMFMRQIRVTHWFKNFLILVPLVLSVPSAGVQAESFFNGMLAFLGMCFLCSVVYILNDFVDLQSDRKHEEKRCRPMAAGDLSVGDGAMMIFGLLLVALTCLAYLPITAQGLVATYFVGSCFYSFGVKRVLHLDCIWLSLLYVLRIGIGVSLLDSDIPVWLILFGFFLFLSLAYAKRVVELLGVVQKSEDNQLLPGRAYKSGDIKLIQMIGISVGICSASIFGMYVNLRVENNEFVSTVPALLMVPVLVFWILRLWTLIFNGECAFDPVTQTLRDKVSLFLGFMMVCLFMIAVGWVP